MQVTISLLPASLSLVHIPRSRLAQLSHPVLKQILQPNPGFLNVTLNEFELSLFAEHHVLEDFEPIARRDRLRQRSRSGSNSSQKRGRIESPEPIEISYEKWNVLQIDSHSDQIDNSGARVHELSAPLAAAGISILYQSSYMSDFIFVKATRLKEVMQLFESAGFDLYCSDFSSMSISPPSSPILSEDRASSIDASPVTEGGAVLTRSRSGTDTSVAYLTSIMSKINSKESCEDPRNIERPATPRTKSHSPTSGDVCILAPDLTCVGLSDESADYWGLKIIKLVAFPELIPDSPSPNASKSPYLSDYPSQVHSPLLERNLPTTSNISRRRGGTSSSASSSDSSDEEAYFSHSPPGNHSSSSLVTSASRSCSDLPNLPPAYKPLSRHMVSSLTPLSPITPTPESRPAIFTSPKFASDQVSTAPALEQSTRVPFFSFTRTPEGSSLTTDISLLATLFPRHERHMVICGGELDAADDRLANGTECSSDEDDEDDSDFDRNTLKCLQIDLRRFGLDKHGLVNRFSRVLEQNGINHMYSSTFKTANLLVEKRHAVRAQALLRAC